MKKQTRLILLGIFLLAAILRIPLTSVGPLLPRLNQTTGLSMTTLSQLTSISLLVFAFTSIIVARIATKIGLNLSIVVSIILMLIGIFIRSFTNNFGLFLGTIILAVGICFGNVLLPALTKRYFPQHVGKITSGYTITMNFMGAVGSSLAIPVLEKVNNLPLIALATVGIIIIPILFLWLLIYFSSPSQQSASTNSKITAPAPTNLYRSKTAWSLATFMGIQSLIFYTCVAWLPNIIDQKGYSPATGGFMLGLLQLMILPASFLVPMLAEKMHSQSIFIIIAGSTFIVGITLLLSSNYIILLLASILLGLATGASFSLCLMLFTLRTKQNETAASLSGMSQTIGYTLAALGPTIFGLIATHTNSIGWALLFLIILGFLMIILGFQAGRPGTID
ncbi:transporter, major facilitator family [Fructilactobacillus florum 8D]|uniref:Transporter, major facilitator family n=3 Tax=Fructilactobacillus florum TaxID=640331 RepID=W9EGX9_9LACO|nr:MFS transporter [Fructilactobacillus florum]ETO40501.1 transporter, major facilitator family [Fructilactobacillus florum 8D]KRM91315.1 transport protein [Fructilactobacillus florum DSM 22689 = JCM 16035]